MKKVKTDFFLKNNFFLGFTTKETNKWKNSILYL